MLCRERWHLNLILTLELGLDCVTSSFSKVQPTHSLQVTSWSNQSDKPLLILSLPDGVLPWDVLKGFAHRTSEEATDLSSLEGSGALSTSTGASWFFSPGT